MPRTNEIKKAYAVLNYNGKLLIVKISTFQAPSASWRSNANTKMRFSDVPHRPESGRTF